MRLKVRYYICLLDLGTGPTSTIDAAASISAADISLAVRTTLQEVFGDVIVGACTSTLSVKYYSPVTRLLLLRGPAAAATQVHTALTLIRTVRKVAPLPVAIRVLQVCGSLRTMKPLLMAWHARLAAALNAGVDDLLDTSFMAALEAELEGATA